MWHSGLGYGKENKESQNVAGSVGVPPRKGGVTALCRKGSEDGLELNAVTLYGPHGCSVRVLVNCGHSFQPGLSWDIVSFFRLQVRKYGILLGSRQQL